MRVLWIMTFAPSTEHETERWLEPFTARVRMPGYRRQLFESTRLFFDLYWQLLELGYSEQQIADHAVMWGARSQLPRELVIAQAVFDLAEHNSLSLSPAFGPPNRTARTAP